MTNESQGVYAPLGTEPYTCPKHGDQTNTGMHIKLYDKNFHKVFCIECFAEKLEEIGVQELTKK